MHKFNFNINFSKVAETQKIDLEMLVKIGYN